MKNVFLVMPILLALILAYAIYTEQGDVLRLARTPFPTRYSQTATPQEKATPVPAKDPCLQQVVYFRGKITPTILTARTLLNHMRNYAENGIKSSFDKSYVELTFHTINTTVVPQCVEQPGVIIYNLTLMRDTMIPAFIEMKFERGSKESRARVDAWVNEVEGFLGEVDRLMAEIK